MPAADVRVSIQDGAFKLLQEGRSSIFVELDNIFFQKKANVDVIAISNVTVPDAPVIPMSVESVGSQFLSAEGAWKCNYLLMKRK